MVLNQNRLCVLVHRTWLHTPATRFFLSISLRKTPNWCSNLKGIQRKPHPGLVAGRVCSWLQGKGVSPAGLELEFCYGRTWHLKWVRVFLRADNLAGMFRMLTTLSNVEILNSLFMFVIYLWTMFMNLHSKTYLSFKACVTALTCSSTRPTLFASSLLY